MDVLMPQLGETVAEGKISKWFVAAGDAVKPGDNLFEIETDKVSMEVPAIAAGTLAAIHVQAGEVAPVGAVVAVIQGGGESVSLSKPQAPLTPAKAGVQGQAKKELDSGLRGNERIALPKSAVPMEPFREVRTPARNYGPARLPGGTAVTPLARRLAGEAGIDLSNLKGSGPHGRIVAADVESAKNAKPALALAQITVIATVTLTADVEIGQSLALCDQANAAQKDAKLELADVIVKAWALALARIMPEQADIAVATGNERAVVSDAAGKSLTAIAAARRDGSDAATSSAISIPGVPGIIAVADMLLPPQTTLLSLGAPRRAPLETPDGAVRFSSVITATLACDPMTLDAADGAALLSAFKGFVEQPVTMIV
jgi:pyruvate dehydrogenase E2 component (dihydrolipoamide acetyltransferase)